MARFNYKAPTHPSTAIFAGGCFWCMQPVFDAIDGVIKTTVGYTGGHALNPTYEQVGEGRTGHVEAIAITYDPASISYKTLVEEFFGNIDPFDANGQFADTGEPYHTVIFYTNDEERHIATEVTQAIEAQFAHRKVATQLKPRTPFYPAEEYHQDFYKKNTLRYNLYKHGSGRVTRLKEIWGKK